MPVEEKKQNNQVKQVVESTRTQGSSWRVMEERLESHLTIKDLHC